MVLRYDVGVDANEFYPVSIVQIKDFLELMSKRERIMSREDNIQIFQDTEKMLQNAIRNSIKHQKLILENDIISKRDRKKYTEPAQVIISKKRSFEAASAYKNQKVCVHNFASATNPGGGVARGSNAQEECLCRCSDLYFCLNIQEMWKKEGKS